MENAKLPTEQFENTFNKEEFDSFVQEALNQIKEVNGAYKKLFIASEAGKESVINEIETRLEDIKQKYEYLFLSNQEGVSKIAEINASIDDIKKYHRELLDGESSIKAGIEESRVKITAFYVYLFGGEGSGEGKDTEVKNAIENILKFNEDLKKDDGYEVIIGNAHSKITALYDELFSTPELEKESKVDKLKKEIENISQFNVEINSEVRKFISDTQTEIKTKTDDINALLSSATAKTLGQGYLESMEKHGFIGLKDNNFTWGAIFKWLSNAVKNLLNYSLFVFPLIVIGIIFIEPDFAKRFLEIRDFGGSRLDGVEYILYKISVSLPLLWISWYGQRSISHEKRLFEEYNHKLRVVQMYLLFISKENSYSINQMTELEDILLDAIRRNPVEVYGKDETMLDKIVEVIKESKYITKNVVDMAADIPSVATETKD